MITGSGGERVWASSIGEVFSVGVGVFSTLGHMRLETRRPIADALIEGPTDRAAL